MTEGRGINTSICIVFFKGKICAPEEGLLCAYPTAVWSGWGRNCHLQGEDIETHRTE